jgi:hypothetical protein
MAVATNKDFFVRDLKVGPKTIQSVLYVLIGVVAMGIAIPAALATGGGMFDECFTACAAQ